MIFANQTELFNYLWETKKHVSEVSGKPLVNRTHFKWHWQFSHVLGKGLYPKFKLREDNVILILPEEHTMWGEQQWKIKDMPEWKWVIEKYEALKIEYHTK